MGEKLDCRWEMVGLKKGRVQAKQFRERENALLRNNKKPKSGERSQVLQRIPQEARLTCLAPHSETSTLEPGRTCPAPEARLRSARPRSLCLQRPTHCLSANHRQREAIPG